MFAHVTAGVVDSVGNPPQLVFVDERWWDLRSRDLATLAVVGWYPVQEATRPADTASTTWAPVFTFNVSVVVQTWTETAKTPEQLAAETAAAALDTLRTAVKAIITDVKAEKDALDLKFPAGITNATINANPASYIKDVEKALERTMRAVIDIAKLVDGKV